MESYSDGFSGWENIVDIYSRMEDADKRTDDLQRKSDDACMSWYVRSEKVITGETT